jgi:hypothetical protein
MKLKEAEDWYQVQKERIISLGGIDLINYYLGSLSNAIIAIYTEVIHSPLSFGSKDNL